MASGAWAGIPVGPSTSGGKQRPVASAQPTLPIGGGALPYSGGGGNGLPYSQGGAATAAGAASSSSAPSLTLKADTNQALNALLSRQDQHLDNLTNNSGAIMDTAASRIRDLREGGRRQLQEDSLFRGAASDPSLSAYDAETTGMATKAIADTAVQREGNLTNAIQGGLGVAGAPAAEARAEKGLQVSAYQAEQAAKNQNFASWLALLNASRTSPIYTG